MRKSVGHIPQLDGLRGCAACMVFLHHMMQGYQNQQIAPAVIWLSGQGSRGVDIFFVLSGFLITSILLADRAKPHYFHNFYWKRVLRIQPVLWLHLALLALFHHYRIVVEPCFGYIALSVLFLVNFGGGGRLRVLSDRYGGPAWTLAIEEQFYLLWPLVVRRLRAGNIYRFALLITIGSLLLRLGVFAAKGSIDIRYTFYRCDGLGFGALLALQYMEAPCGRIIARVLGLLNAKWSGVLGLMLGVALFCPNGRAYMGQMQECFAIFVVSFLAYRTIRHVVVHPRAFAWLAWRVPVYLGAISYAMYMFHIFVIDLYDSLVPLHTFYDARAFLLRLAATFAATLAVSSLSLVALERPINGLRGRVLKRSPAV